MINSLKKRFILSWQLGRMIERLILCGLIGILLLAPLAFGSVHVWAYTLVMLGVMILWQLWLILHCVSHKSSELFPIDKSLKIILIALLSIIISQLTPLPHWMVSIISSRTAEDWNILRTVLSNPGVPETDTLYFVTLAYYKHPVIMGLIRLVTYMLMFFLVLNLINSAKRMHILIIVLIGSGVFQAVYGFRQTFGYGSGIWWYQTSGNYPFIRGTFISSNHFAYYIEIIFFLCLGYLLASVAKNKTIQLSFQRSAWRKFKTFMTDFFSTDASKLKYMLHIIVTVILGVTIILSGSRAGIISICVTFMCLLLLMFFYRGKFKKIPVLIALIALGALYVGMEPTINKFTRVEGLHDRLETTQSILPMIRDYPLLGVGWGNFSYVYPRYIRDYDRVSSSGYAHNDWVESIIELGVVGGLLLIMFYVLFLWKLINRWRAAHDIRVMGIGAGVIAGLISTGIHNYFDFSLRMPANPITLAAAAAIGYAALTYRQSPTDKNSLAPASTARTKSQLAFNFVSAVLIFLTICAMMHYLIRNFQAEIKCPTEANSTLNLNWNPYLTDIEQAIALNPLNAGYHLKKARFFLHTSFNDPQTVTFFYDNAIENLIKTLKLNPLTGIAWYHLGIQYQIRHQVEGEDTGLWLDKADLCMKAAVRFAKMDANILTRAAEYWLNRSVDIGSHLAARSSEIEPRTDTIRQFQSLFKRVLEIRPNQLTRIAHQIWEHYPDINLIREILPEDDLQLQENLDKWYQQIN